MDLVMENVQVCEGIMSVKDIVASADKTELEELIVQAFEEFVSYDRADGLESADVMKKLQEILDDSYGE